MAIKVEFGDSPRITAFGGGTGLSALLRGLKDFTEEITAVVTVADDGGGSGKIRQDFGILPPGDIRNCIVALANVEPLMEQLLQYRFTEGSLKGQCIGNLLIAAMTDLCSGFEKAVKEISSVFAVTGRVLPVTLDNVTLRARLSNGEIIDGESRIPKAQIEQNSPIDRIFVVPPDAAALPEALKAIADSDCIVIGPGSLYTSIIPNLLIPGISDAIRKSKAKKLYVANIMTQPGETAGYKLEDHIEAIIRHGGDGLIDTAVVNAGKPPEEILARYRADQSVPVEYEECSLQRYGIKLAAGDLLDYSRGYLRHNPYKLARFIMDHI